MTTLTIQIGNSDDKLTQKQWSDFVGEVQNVLNYWIEQSNFHFFATSDNCKPWQNACWVVTCTSEDTVKGLEINLTKVRKRFNQDSVAVTEGFTKFV